MNQSIRDIEIFSSGTHNGDAYSEADLDEIVRNFGRTGFEIPVKDGHHQVPGAPALGWVRNLRKVGKKLVCNFIDVPEAVYQAIRDRRYNHISSEIYWNLKNSKGTFRRCLKAVSLLGSEAPAVPDLKPLRETVFDAEFKRHTVSFTGGYYMFEESESEEAREYRIASEKDRLDQEKHDACQVVDLRVRQYMTENQGVDYVTAYRIVLERNPDLKERYGSY